MVDSLIQFFTQQIGVQGIWFALCLLIGWQYNKKSEQREQQLIDELHNSQDLLKTMADKYDLISNKLDVIESKLGGSATKEGGV
jgi:hypothetical protein